MHTKARFLAAAVISLALGMPGAWADEALKLAQRVHQRPAGSNLTTDSRMDLTERGRAPRTRELVTYRRDTGGGESASLIRFLAPRDVAGTGMLSITRADGSREQQLYLPALDRVRRIAGDRQGGRFVGSDLYFEDLQERQPSRDRHRLLGTETVGGVACEVLESVPLDAADSAYSRRVSWVDPQTLLIHRVDYYERDPQQPAKRWELLAAERIQGYWTVTDSTMTDLRSGHQTRMTVLNAVYDRDLPARLFSAQALAAKVEALLASKA